MTQAMRCTFGAGVWLLSWTILLGCGDSGLARSEETIRQEALRSAPKGTTKPEVLLGLSEKVRIEVGRVDPGVDGYPSEEPVGSSFVRAHLGSYGWMLTTDVMAVYYFDDAEKLLDVRIVKYREGL